jgi:hypothetical protein
MNQSSPNSIYDHSLPLPLRNEMILGTPFPLQNRHPRPPLPPAALTSTPAAAIPANPSSINSSASAANTSPPLKRTVTSPISLPNSPEIHKTSPLSKASTNSWPISSSFFPKTASPLAAPPSSPSSPLNSPASTPPSTAERPTHRVKSFSTPLAPSATEPTPCSHPLTPTP